MEKKVIFYVGEEEEKECVFIQKPSD